MYCFMRKPISSKPIISMTESDFDAIFTPGYVLTLALTGVVIALLNLQR